MFYVGFGILFFSFYHQPQRETRKNFFIFLVVLGSGNIASIPSIPADKEIPCVHEGCSGGDVFWEVMYPLQDIPEYVYNAIAGPLGSRMPLVCHVAPLELIATCSLVLLCITSTAMQWRAIRVQSASGLSCSTPRIDRSMFSGTFVPKTDYNAMAGHQKAKCLWFVMQYPQD